MPATLIFFGGTTTMSFFPNQLTATPMLCNTSIIRLTSSIFGTSNKIVLPELGQIVRREEVRRETEINYTVMTEEEFEFRKRRRDPFITDIVKGARLMIIGDEAELVK